MTATPMQLSTPLIINPKDPRATASDFVSGSFNNLFKHVHDVVGCEFASEFLLETCKYMASALVSHNGPDDAGKLAHFLVGVSAAIEQEKHKQTAPTDEQAPSSSLKS